jgi:hypothetical protein
MPRKRSSGIRRAIQAAVYKQNKNLRREANAQVRAAIEPQVAEPQVVNPQVAEPQAVQPQAIKQKSLEERIRQAVGIFNIIQDLHRRIPPQQLHQRGFGLTGSGKFSISKRYSDRITERRRTRSSVGA